MTNYLTIKLQCVKIFEFDFIDKDQTSVDNILVEPTKSYQVPWLYGPATSLSSRTVIYPCNRYRCALPCPCKLCQKIDLRCHETNFSDHVNTCGNTNARIRSFGVTFVTLDFVGTKNLFLMEKEILNICVKSVVYSSVL